jgi:CelD/BcsL family acetyltransferase involved in cellulose biosynthesis
LHRLRWTGRAERFGFSDGGYLSFHHRIAERFAVRGWLRLYGLEVSGAVIAAWYGYRYSDVLYYYQSGFDPEWAAHSPGMVLKAAVIRDAIDEGVKELDLLKGAHPYKRSWADRSRRTVRLMVARPGVRGRLLVAPAWLEERKRHLKAALPAAARVWLSRLKDAGSRSEADAHAAR